MPNKNGIYKNIVIDDSIKDKILYRLDLVEKDYIIEDYFHTQIAIIFIDASNNNLIVENVNDLIQVEVEEDKLWKM